MPIPATRDQVQEDQPTPVPLPPVPMQWAHTYVSVTGRDGQGEEIPLTAFQDTRWPAIFIQPGATGLDAPPFELHADASPNLDGSMFRSSRAAAREIMIPVYLYGIDRKTLRDLKRSLAAALNPKFGYCVLKFMESDSQPRYLRCYYKGGMEGNEAEDQAGFKWVKYGLQFTAFDPWYYSDEIQVAQWQLGSGSEPFNPPGVSLLPLKLNRGGLASSTIPVVNPGEVEAWPKWEITGPVASFKFTSADGMSFGIGTGTAVPAGRTLTIDTRPGYKTLTDDQGRNYWPDLDPSPQLWSIAPGRTRVGISVTASSPASLRLTIRPRFETY